MANAVGMIEVFGLTAAFVAADAGCKAEMLKLKLLIEINLQMQMSFRFHLLLW